MTDERDPDEVVDHIEWHTQPLGPNIRRVLKRLIIELDKRYKTK